MFAIARNVASAATKRRFRGMACISWLGWKNQDAMIVRARGSAVLRPYKIAVRRYARLALEAEPRDESYAAGGAGRRDLAKLEGVHCRVYRRIVDEVEDVRGLQAEFESARLFDGDGLAE